MILCLKDTYSDYYDNDNDVDSIKNLSSFSYLLNFLCIYFYSNLQIYLPKKNGRVIILVWIFRYYLQLRKIPENVDKGIDSTAVQTDIYELDWLFYLTIISKNTISFNMQNRNFVCFIYWGIIMNKFSTDLC